MRKQSFTSLKILAAGVSLISLLSSCWSTHFNCDKEVPDYFFIDGLDVYSLKLDTVEFGTREVYIAQNQVDSASQSDFGILGLFDESNFGFEGDECPAVYGDLGASELTKNIQLIDLISDVDFTHACYLSETWTNRVTLDEFEVNNQGTPTNWKKAEVDSLNSIDYRMEEPEFLIKIDTTLNKGVYNLELTYELESITFIDTISLRID